MADIPVGVAEFPCEYLEKTTASQGKSVWQGREVAITDKSGFSRWIARGRLVPVLVLSHSCELDKAERKGRVVVVPIALANTVSPQVWDTIRSRGRLSLFPLPTLPTLGDAYADLRLMSAVDRKYLEVGPRLASMSEDGLKVLKNHIVGFIARPG